MSDFIQTREEKGTCQADWKWSDTYIPAVKQIVGPHLIMPADLMVDIKRATDFELIAEHVAIACRIRDFHRYHQKYSTQFTIRVHRDSGAKTEFEKILEGHGDLFFYGFGVDRDKTIPAWYLIDLSAFRQHWETSQGVLSFGNQSNGDGTYFRWFDVFSFPQDPPLLIDSCQWKGEVEKQKSPATCDPVEVAVNRFKRSSCETQHAFLSRLGQAGYNIPKIKKQKHVSKRILPLFPPLRKEIVCDKYS